MRDALASDEIARLLEQAGFDYQRHPSMGGLRPDFLVRGPVGQVVVIEVKAWNPAGGNTARALNQAGYYKRITKADRALVVLPHLKRSFKEKGVVSADALVETLSSYFGRPTPRKPKPAGEKRGPAPTVFAAMPFDREYDDTYFVAMSYAAERVDAACTRVDRTEFSGDIVEEIKHLISSSMAVIVDLSESKPNVLYEAGYAHALKKPAVHICSTPLEHLPFDVRNWNTMPYDKGQTTTLREPLARRLAALVHER